MKRNYIDCYGKKENEFKGWVIFLREKKKK